VAGASAGGSAGGSAGVSAGGSAGVSAGVSAGEPAGPALLLRRTLAALLTDLGPGFARTHRSAAVALARVATLQSRDKGDATLMLKSGAQVPCSRQYRNALIAALQR
jgi:hypothetical protein